MKLQPLRVEVRKAVLRKQSFFAPKQEIPALGNSDLLFRPVGDNSKHLPCSPSGWIDTAHNPETVRKRCIAKATITAPSQMLLLLAIAHTDTVGRRRATRNQIVEHGIILF